LARRSAVLHPRISHLTVHATVGIDPAGSGKMPWLPQGLGTLAVHNDIAMAFDRAIHVMQASCPDSPDPQLP